MIDQERWTTPTRMGMTPEQRFWDKISPEPNSGCWLWTATLDRKGYGQFIIGRNTSAAHRVSYEVEKGPIPDGLQIDHLCRVRSLKKKTHCKHGHEFSEENTYVTTKGYRNCRACMRLNDRNRAIVLKVVKE